MDITFGFYALGQDLIPITRCITAEKPVTSVHNKLVSEHRYCVVWHGAEQLSIKSAVESSVAIIPTNLPEYLSHVQRVTILAKSRPDHFMWICNADCAGSGHGTGNHELIEGFVLLVRLKKPKKFAARIADYTS